MRPACSGPGAPPAAACRLQLDGAALLRRDGGGRGAAGVLVRAGGLGLWRDLRRGGVGGRGRLGLLDRRRRLRRARLRRGRRRGARLRRGRRRGARLRGLRLCGARLCRLRLRRACLGRACLGRARLRRSGGGGGLGRGGLGGGRGRLGPRRGRGLRLRGLLGLGAGSGALPDGVLDHLLQRAGLVLGGQQPVQRVADLGEALEGLGVVLGERGEPLGRALVDHTGAALGRGEGALGLQPGAGHRLLGLLLGGRQDAVGLLLGGGESVVGLLLRLGEVPVGVGAGLVDDPLRLVLGVLADLLALGLGLGQLLLGLVLGQVDDLPEPVAQVVAGRLAGLPDLGHLAADPLDLVLCAGEPRL
ncbi:pentapeptide repeat-containing protein [Actinomadura luteofluorescens]|uniref:pentapeptide repeat-containing protein n=1 Tax=Actinomadura luteofluorescens TaxID=46163 RepID=UPI0035E415B5